MAVIVPVFASRRPFGCYFDRSLSLRSEMDRLWSDMESVLFSDRMQSSTTDNAKVESPQSTSVVPCNDGSFQVSVPVSGFKPEELSVKMMGDSLLIEGQHEEKDEKGLVVTHQTMQRRVPLPKSVDREALASKLSADGVLTISAPKKAIEPPEPEKVIQIQVAEPGAAQVASK